MYDANGRFIPVFTPGASQLEQWIATRGANLDVRTLSLYAQDDWAIESQIGQNSPVANPAFVLLDYVGPGGQGGDFEPGFNPANYEISSGSFPTANVFLEEGLSSPITREFTASVGHQINSRGSAKLTYIHRNYYNFIEDFIDNPTDAGRTTVVFEGTNFGTFDNIVFRNSDVPQRKYDALLLQGQYRLYDRLRFEGHWTIQLRNEGNFEGEAANQPGISSRLATIPKCSRKPATPVGRLNDFQRSKLRVWAIYTQEIGRFGALDTAPILRVDSA